MELIKNTKYLNKLFSSVIEFATFDLSFLHLIQHLIGLIFFALINRSVTFHRTIIVSISDVSMLMFYSSILIDDIGDTKLLFIVEWMKKCINYSTKQLPIIWIRKINKCYPVATNNERIDIDFLLQKGFLMEF